VRGISHRREIEIGVYVPKVRRGLTSILRKTRRGVENNITGEDRRYLQPMVALSVRAVEKPRMRF
jgi:hypothetical protein